MAAVIAVAVEVAAVVAVTLVVAVVAVVVLVGQTLLWFIQMGFLKSKKKNKSRGFCLPNRWVKRILFF